MAESKATTLVPLGMVSFSKVLTKDQATSIRAYLIQRANDTKAAQAKGEDLTAG